MIIRLAFVIFLAASFVLSSSLFGNYYAGVAAVILFGTVYGTKRGRRLVFGELNKIFSNESSDSIELATIKSVIDRLESYPTTIDEHMTIAHCASHWPGVLKSYFDKLDTLKKVDSVAKKESSDSLESDADRFQSYIDRLESRPSTIVEYMGILNFAYQRPEWVKYYFNKLDNLDKVDSDARNVEGIVIDLEPVGGSNHQLRFVISNQSDRTFRNLKISYGLLFPVYMYSLDDTHMYPRPEPDPPLEIDNFPPGSQEIFFREELHIVTHHKAYEKEVAYLEFVEDDHRYQSNDRRWCWINIKLSGVKPRQGFSGYP